MNSMKRTYLCFQTLRVFRNPQGLVCNGDDFYLKTTFFEIPYQILSFLLAINKINLFKS